MGCFTEFLGHCIRLIFLLFLFHFLMVVLITTHDMYSDRKIIQVDVSQDRVTVNEVDITLCPTPPLNYTRLLEVGHTYRAVAHRLEGELFENMTAPRGVGAVFADMNRCLQRSQVMKPTEDLLDRIDVAVSVGCVGHQAEQMANSHNKTAAEYLRHLVIEHSYRLLADYFERKDGLNFYYSHKIFKGIEYLKWDNLSTFDFLERIAIKPAKIIKIRPRFNSSWIMTEIHTRHAPSCARYRVRLDPDQDVFRATFDIEGTVCQESLSNTVDLWRRDFCHSDEGVGLLLRATAAQGYRALGGLFQRPPLWLPLDRSSVIELVASKKKRDANFCSNRRDQSSRQQCLRSCLIDSALGQIDCMFPWLENTDEGSTTPQLPYCNTYKSAAEALAISDGLLDHPESSQCWQHCPEDCSELEVDTTLAGQVEQPAADSQRTISILLHADLAHTTTAMVEVPSLTQWLATVASVVAYHSGVSLLSLTQWLMGLTMWLGGARRYLGALRPICVADLYLGRAMRRARVAYRWIWRPQPERPWLRPVKGRPRPDTLCSSLLPVTIGQPAERRPFWSSVLAELDSESESDTESVKDAVDLHGRLVRLRASVLEFLRGCCGQAAEQKVLKEIEAELAMEEELDQLAEMVSSNGIVFPTSSSLQRQSIYSHGRRGGRHGSHRPSMMPSGSRHSSRGQRLLSALGGVGANASRYSPTGHHSHGASGHRRLSLMSQTSSRRSSVHRPSYVPGVEGPPSTHHRPSSPDRHSPHEHQRAARGHRPSAAEHSRSQRPSFFDMSRGGHRSSVFDVEGNRRPSSFSMDSGHRPSFYSMGSGHQPSMRQMRGGIPSFHDDVRSRMSSLVGDKRSHIQPFPEERHGRRPSAYYDDRSPPGGQRLHEEGRGPSQHRRPSHYDSGNDHIPPPRDDLEHGRRSSHYDEAHGRRPSHYDDGRRPSFYDDGRRPSFYDDGRRPSHMRGRGPGRGRGRGRPGRGRGRGRGSGRGTRPSISPDDA
ncbi:uncharacterized protein LOC122370041 isoform X2 [Amphibalanus amphitrite]|uniref:uncharacterized protein LOC122370041 isoform X2 n=1 Tax=Amphibalanus amphitrite TaxID=1232801 RepID=UPI001C91134B|nr:uncharacterized protein LOC122370041 isoform X2 [Amphibalanus amphitrite]